MGSRRPVHVANAARFQLRYGELIAALLLGILSWGSALALGGAMERLTAHELNGPAAVMAQVAPYDPAEGTSSEIGPTSTGQQRVLDLWFDEPNARDRLPRP
jgi:hypothetical protein